MPTATVFFAVLVAATKKTSTSGSSIGTLLFFVVLFVLFYVFFLRPRSMAARRQRDTLIELSAGDEVLTGAGIYGTVLDVEPDRVTLETAPGTRITVVRSTIARRITEQDASSVAEQNWHDENHDGVAEAAGWHDPSERDPDDDTTDHETGGSETADHDASDHDAAGGHEDGAAHEGTEDEPDADAAPGTAQGGGR
jgi:preprotein translocase subunit YajC